MRNWLGSHGIGRKTLVSARTFYDASMLAATLLITVVTLTASQQDTRVLDVNTFEWKFEQERVVLGETKRAAITLLARNSDGTPLDIAAPTLKASTGVLTTPVRVSPGTWRTQYVPPSARFPHVALLSAQIDTDAGLAVGFSAVPLWGKGRLNVKTKPHSQVVVSIGNLEFGPSKSDGKGIAVVDIIAPPGPERAVAKIKDEFGNTSQEVVDLGVPAFNRLSLISLDDVATADGSGEAQLLLYLVDKKGEAMIDAPIDVTSNVGGLKQLPQGLSPGLFRLRFGPGTTKLTHALVTVALQGSNASRATVDINLIPGGPKRASIVQSATELSAEDVRAVTLVVALFDSAGNAVPPAAGRAVVDVGRISSQKIEGLVANYTWILPARLDGAAAAVLPPSGRGDDVAARVSDDQRVFIAEGLAQFFIRDRAGDVVGKAMVRLVPGPPHRLTLSPLRELRGDGKDAVQVFATVSDVVGNVLPADAITFESDRGEIKAPTVDGAKMRGLFVPTRLNSQENAKVGRVIAKLTREKEEPLTTSTPVRVVPVRLTPKLLLGVGVVTDYNLQTYAAAGPELSLLMMLPFVDGHIYAGMRLGALLAIPLAAPPIGDDKTTLVGHVAIPLWADLQWRQKFSDVMPEPFQLELLELRLDQLEFHVGGALGVTMSDRTDDDGSVIIRTGAAAPTAMAIFGIGYPLGPGAIEAELHAGFGWPLTASPSRRLAWAPMATGLTLRYRFDSF